MTDKYIGLLILPVIAGVTGLLGHLLFDVSIWVGVGLALCSLMVNGLIIEWEDRQLGGCSK